jgi:hypothetical protein
MKSRKKVSRKKTARRKTSMRRNSKRMKSGRQRFTRIKRGGTIPARVIQQLRTFMVHNILPIVTQARPNIHLGHDPQPADSSITNVNDRFRQTFADIKFEDGDIIESIRNFFEEVKNPVKSADKSSTLMGKYEMLMKKLNEEEKQTKEELMVVGTSAFTPIHTKPEKIKPSFLNVGHGAASGSDSPMASFINPPLTYSPDPIHYPQYSTKTETPAKPPPKSKTRPSPTGSLEINGTPLRPFELDKSKTSPKSPPPLSERGKNPKSLLSPSSAPVRKLPFDE